MGRWSYAVRFASPSARVRDVKDPRSPEHCIRGLQTRQGIGANLQATGPRTLGLSGSHILAYSTYLCISVVWIRPAISFDEGSLGGDAVPAYMEHTEDAKNGLASLIMRQYSNRDEICTWNEATEFPVRNSTVVKNSTPSFARGQTTRTSRGISHADWSVDLVGRSRRSRVGRSQPALIDQDF